MLQIVWDSIGTDFTQTFYGSFESTDFFHMMARLTPEDATQNVDSFIKSRETTVNKLVRKLLIDIKNRE